MKYEWRRQEKQLYGAKTTPVLVTVPTQSCIMINGEGNPNDTDFSNRVSALYSVAYAVKMAYKRLQRASMTTLPSTHWRASGRKLRTASSSRKSCATLS